MHSIAYVAATASLVNQQHKVPSVSAQAWGSDKAARDRLCVGAPNGGLAVLNNSMTSWAWVGYTKAAHSKIINKMKNNALYI